MLRKLKISAIVFVVAWVITFVVALIIGLGRLDFEEILSLSTIIAAIFGVSTLSVFMGIEGPSAPPPSRDTGLMSCMKCGYLGVGSGGGCPRCGWTYTEKIKTDTTIISCPDCGYLGVGAGSACPKCGHTRAQRVK